MFRAALCRKDDDDSATPIAIMLESRVIHLRGAMNQMCKHVSDRTVQFVYAMIVIG